MGPLWSIQPRFRTRQITNAMQNEALQQPGQTAERIFHVGDTFPRGGGRHFTATIIRRAGKWALCEIRHPEISRPHWEVVVIRYQKPRVLSGVSLPGGERMPASEEWGTYGWTYPSLDAATDSFESKSTSEETQR